MTTTTTPLTTAELRDYLTWLEDEWVPSLDEQLPVRRRPVLRLIPGGKDDATKEDGDAT